MLSKQIQQQFKKIVSKAQQQSFATSSKVVPVSQAPQVKKNSKLPKESEIYLEYKQYPTHLAHNDPKSPKYIHSELDEYQQNAQVDGYNETIRQLKQDLKTQEKVYDMIQKMDRPYLSGKPGVHQNITGGVKDYFPPEDLGFKTEGEEPENKFLSDYMRNQDRFLQNTPFYPKYAKGSHIEQWKKDLDERPVNDHYHADKGFKYDVAVPYDQRYPFVADRLGHPEVLGTPWERLLRLEGDMYHPNYLDQPFIQMPDPSPSDSLSFEEGEVIYENSRLQEWVKFWGLTGLTAYAWSALFVPYQYIFKTHLPLAHSYDNLFLTNYRHSYFFYDNNGIHIPIVAGAILYSMYAAQAMFHSMSKAYVIKMQYNKDKELLFVTRSSPFGSKEEQVYEMAHLEILPPSVKSSVQHLSSQDKDGLWELTCMNSIEGMVLYNEDKYWNPTLKKEFMSKVMNLWDQSYVGYNRAELAEQNQKLESEFEKAKLIADVNTSKK